MLKTEETSGLIKTLKENHKIEIEQCKTEEEQIALVFKEQNVLLMDIATSLSIIADILLSKPKTEEEKRPISHWLPAGPHAVKCENCGMRLSSKAAYDMDYCFKCGRRMINHD